jgi:uncharacterized protein
MRLYAGMSNDFVRDTTHNQITDKLTQAFFAYYRYKPSPSEVRSWQNSLKAMALIVIDACLEDHGVVLEYQLPLTSKRLDFLICGKDQAACDRAIIVELKQWEQCEHSEVDKTVLSRVGGALRPILHPSIQVGQYQQYLEDSHTAFHEGPAPIQLNSCAYLHNYTAGQDDPLRDTKFDQAILRYPLFDANGSVALSHYLGERLVGGQGSPVLERIELSRNRASRKLMDHVAETIKSHSPWILLDEQLVIYEEIIATVTNSRFGRSKQIVLVKGGPGTGKSVIAINLLARLAKLGKSAHYATGSKAFTETLWSILGSRSKTMVRYFNSYGEADYSSIDILICDESHRLRETSNNRFTPKAKRRNKPQIQEIIDASKVSVFFIDDKQVVRPNEIGSTQYIREIATKGGYELTEYELAVQFRCAGSDGFVNWINNTLGIERTANVLWDGADGFEFKILDSPESLENAIRARAGEGYSARVAAGFCWPWSEPRADGTLVDDVVIGDYRRPWDAKPGNWKLAPGIPSASLWATDANGINQVGCVYNIQGFELDYIGVIWGKDLVYDFDTQTWVGNKKESADQVVKRSKEKFSDLVKNTYRVLLSRGLRGCYVHFMDKDTERYIRTRMEGRTLYAGIEIKKEINETQALPFIKIRSNEIRPNDNCVPIVDLKIAAGYFNKSTAGNPDEVEWAKLPNTFHVQPDSFIAQVIGESMNKKIPNGAWCLFRANPAGTRNGKIVLVQHRNISDPEHGGSYTIKRYRSEKETTKDETWKHKIIELIPESNDPKFKPIVFDGEKDGDLRVVAEFVAVL